MGTGIEVEDDYWLQLARHTPLVVISDLDGTLIPFAPTPEAARPTPEVCDLLSELVVLPGVTVMIASGRPQTTLDEFFPPTRDVLLVAEHGAWRRTPKGWEPMLSLDRSAISSLALELDGLRQRHPASMLELKTWALALHFRKVPDDEKPALIQRATAVIDAWLEVHPDFGRLDGVEVIEVRPRLANKANAVTWARQLLGPAGRLVMVGDDTTDEDMFTAASERDAAILVGTGPERPTAAQWRLDSPHEVQAFYRWIVSLRREGPHASRASNPQPHLPLRMGEDSRGDGEAGR